MIGPLGEEIQEPIKKRKKMILNEDIIYEAKDPLKLYLFENQHNTDFQAFSRQHFNFETH